MRFISDGNAFPVNKIYIVISFKSEEAIEHI